MSTHYVITDNADVTDTYLHRGYRRSERSVAEELGPNYYSIPREQRESLTLLELPAGEHAALNAPERAYRPKFGHNSLITTARVEPVEVLERGKQTSIVAPFVEGGTFNDSYATGDTETADLHLTAERCAQSMEREVRRAIDAHLDAIAELRKFLETKH